MSANIIRAQYDDLEQIAARFAAQAEAVQEQQQRIQQHVSALEGGGWQGQGIGAFSREMRGEVFPAVERLHQALAEAQKVTLSVSVTMRTAEEEAAALFEGGATNEPLTGIDGPSGVPEGSDPLGDWIIDLGKYSPYAQVSMGMLGFAGLKFVSDGKNVIIKSSEFLKSVGLFRGYGGYRNAQSLAGISATRIGAQNLPRHMALQAFKSGPLTKINVLNAVIRTAGQWVKDVRTYDGSELASAIAIDTVLVGGAHLATGYGGAVIGTYVGGVIGGAIGSVIPGPGTAAGAVVGGIVGTAIAGWLTDKYITDPIVESQWRTDAIKTGGRWIDQGLQASGELYSDASESTQQFFDAAADWINQTPMPEVAPP